MKRLMKPTCLAAGSLVLATGTYFAAAGYAENTLRGRLLAEAARHGLVATVGEVRVNPLSGGVAVAGLRAERRGFSIAIGRISTKTGPVLTLVGTAQAQQAQNFTLDDVEISGALGTLSAEELVVEGANLGEDALQDLIDADTAKELIDRLKTLSFRSIKSPEMIFESDKVGAQSTQTFTNVALEGMRNGRLDRVTAASIAAEIKPSNGPAVNGTAGPYEARGVDTVLIARFIGDTAAQGEAPGTAYEFSRLENYKVTIEGVGDYAIGSVETGAVRMRPLRIPLSEIFAKLPTAGQSKPEPEELKRMLPALLEVFDSSSDDGVELRDFKVTPAKAPGSASVQRISGSLGGGKVPVGFRIEGIDVSGPGVSVKLASFTIEGFSLKPTLEAMTKAIVAGDSDLKTIDPRSLLPKIGTYSFRGLEFDVPDTKAASGRLVGGLGLFELAAKNEINGIPTDLALTVDRLNLRLPAESNNAGFQQLRALGYEAIDLSAKKVLRWDEALKEIHIPEFSLSGVDMGSVRVTGTIANVPREIFTGDMATAQIMAMGATLKSKTLRVENTGLAQRLLEMQAKAQGRSADQIKGELGAMAQLMIPAVLGPSDDARAITDAVAGFLSRLKGLSIEANAKNAAGVGLAQLVTIREPKQVMDLFRFSASAD